MRKIILACLLFCSAFSVTAQTATANPAQILQTTLETLTNLSATQANPAQLQGYIEKNLAPLFDFERMSYMVAGPMARSMNPQQQQELIATIQQQMSTALVKGLSEYQNSRIRYFNKRNNRSKVQLGAEIAVPNRPSFTIVFTLHPSNSGWKVIDVSANGISAIAYFRNQFANQMRGGRQN